MECISLTSACIDGFTRLIIIFSSANCMTSRFSILRRILKVRVMDFQCH